MFQSSPTELFSSLGVVSKFVLLILVVFSIASWAIIFYKWWVLRSSELDDQRFLNTYARTEAPFSENSDELRRHARRLATSPSAGVYAGIMDRVHTRQGDGTQRDYLNRVSAYIVQEYITKLESLLPFLATTGNIAPFIGLLGTVIGIIDAFQEIGREGTASIAAVAPGVSEALVATAAGLFAAIPAVIAYNYYLTRIRRAISRVDAFNIEFLNAVESYAHQETMGARS